MSAIVRTKLFLALLVAAIPAPAQADAAEADAEAEARAEAEADVIQDLRWEFNSLSGAFELFVPFPSEEGTVSFIWGDVRGVLHRCIWNGEKLEEVWKSFPLNGKAHEIFVRDLDYDGSPEIITYTTDGVYVWESGDFSLVWDAIDTRFKGITAMAVENVDSDPALELIICADGLISYYDGVNFLREKTGRERIRATRMLVADVDGDQSLEIVTDDGFVLDSHSLTIEWAHAGFGYPMRLVDLNQDGIPELIGKHPHGLQIWDLRDRIEIW